jgi:hypothetical protein|tara:strand:+ start:722 stop:1036 length:315 start_codon:yes stop_codon:yes gene_type:complete
MRYILVSVLCFILFTATANAKVNATAQEFCGLRVDVIKLLKEKYEEEQVAIGLENNNRLVEVFVSRRGTFTILLSYPIGYSCVATLGYGWEMDSFTSMNKEDLL